MNYSTLKKAVALSCVSLMAVGLANAQTDTTRAKNAQDSTRARTTTTAPTATTATTATTTASDTTMKTSSGTTSAKVFGGAGQYNTFSIGANVGVTSAFDALLGNNAVNHFQAALGYGLSLRDQLSHVFGIQLNLNGGTVKGDNRNGGTLYGNQSFSTKFYQATLNGVLQFGSVSFLHRKNSVNFFGTAGGGLAFYNPTYVDGNGNSATYTNADGSKHWVKELVIPVGAGAKFRLSDALALNLGYTLNFLDTYNFTGYKPNEAKSHYSYGYAGLEYTFGPKSKQNIDWVNPVAMMYDELYDAALRQEVEALKGRVGNVENAVSDLKKDSDGDGVADQFDKCPNTPAGTVVDGSGCPIVFPKPDSSAMAGAGVAKAAYSNIQFEFDSSVLRTSSYPALDATSADLRSGAGKKIEVAGYASSEGTAAHNLRLSKDRANSVKTYLVNSGVDAKRIKVKGYGTTHPIATNSTEEGRVLNRRVEFHQK